MSKRTATQEELACDNQIVNRGRRLGARPLEQFGVGLDRAHGRIELGQRDGKTVGHEHFLRAPGRGDKAGGSAGPRPFPRSSHVFVSATGRRKWLKNSLCWEISGGLGSLASQAHERVDGVCRCKMQPVPAFGPAR